MLWRGQKKPVSQIALAFCSLHNVLTEVLAVNTLLQGHKFHRSSWFAVFHLGLGLPSNQRFRVCVCVGGLPDNFENENTQLLG